jgi:hypothetical protein
LIPLIRTGLAGLLLALLAAAPAAAAPAVSVRVEGQTSTLLSRTPVTLLDQTEPNTGCPGDSASAALEIATKGDWDRQPYTQTILGETHDFSNSDYWAVWVFRGDRFVVSKGVCEEVLAEGEQLLAAYEYAPEAQGYAPQIFPMWITGVPATVKPGEPFTVTVHETRCEQFCAAGEGHAVPRPGATVVSGDVTATSDEQGRATLTLSRPGAAGIRATRDGNTPTVTEPTCVTTGSDGECNTVVPCAHDGNDGRCGTIDRRAPEGRVLGIAEQQRFTRTSAPRELKGAVAADPSGLRWVQLRLTRRHDGRCSYFSGTKERFRATRCGRSFAFRIGEQADWSYLLPGRLKPGRYVLDAVAVDRNNNHESLARGRNRIVFFVR